MPARSTPLVLLALGLALLLVTTRSAPPLVRATPLDPATTPLLSAVGIDGHVRGFVPDGDRLYLNGDFSYLGEPMPGLAVLGADGRIPADVTRGVGSIWGHYFGRIIPDGAGGWFAIIGNEDSFWGTGVARLTSSMQLVAGWPVQTEGEVDVVDIPVQEGRLYLAGDFTVIGTAARPGLAALDLAPEPKLAAWAPQLPAKVERVLALAITEWALYISTAFVSIGLVIYDHGMFVYPVGAPNSTSTPTPVSPRSLPYRAYLPQLRR